MALDLWDPEIGALPTTDKVQLALDLEKRVRGSDPRVKQVVSADYGDMHGESAIATSTGIAAATSRRTLCSLSVSVIAGDDTDRHTGRRVRLRQGPAALDPRRIADDAIDGHRV